MRSARGLAAGNVAPRGFLLTARGRAAGVPGPPRGEDAAGFARRGFATPVESFSQAPQAAPQRDPGGEKGAVNRAQ